MRLALVTFKDASGTRFLTGQVLAQTAEKIVIATAWAATGEEEAHTLPMSTVVRVESLVKAVQAGTAVLAAAGVEQKGKQ